MPIYSNRFTVQVADERAGLAKQYTEIMATVSDAEAAATAAAADAADAAASAQAAALSAAFMFDSRAELAAAIGDIPDGQLVVVRGIYAVKDPDANGTASALHDLSVNGITLLGREVLARWWTDEAATEEVPADASSLLNAANTYFIAVKGTGGGTLRVEGEINLANQVTLGAFLNGCNIDASDAYFNAIAGGALTASTPLVIVSGRDAIHRLGTINANRLCSGWQIQGVTNSAIIGPVFRSPASGGFGVKVTGGSCAGATIYDAAGSEWSPSDPEFDVDSSYRADGIVADDFDFRIFGGHIGWIGCGIKFTANAGQVEVINFHPYNGNPNSGILREHPICVINDSAASNRLSACYIDNGYVLDRTGTLVVNDGWHYISGTRVRMDHPFTRVFQTSTITDIQGGVANFPTSLGFQNTQFWNTQSEPLVVLAMGQSNMRGNTDATGGKRTIMPGVYVWNGSATAAGSSFAAPVLGSYPFTLGSAPDYTANLAIATANQLKVLTGRDVYVILMAVGGRPIEDFILPATLAANGWTSTGNLTSQIYAQTPGAIAAIPGRTTTYADAFIWHQGEANGADSSAVYQSKFLAMENDLRTGGLIHASKTVIVAGGLLEGVANRATIETAIRGAMASRANLMWAESDGLAGATSVHFTGAALEEFGGRYADAAMSYGVNMTDTPSAQRGNSRAVGYTKRLTTLIPENSGTTDFNTVKGGTTGVKIVQTFQPGSGAAISQIAKDGRMVFTGRLLVNDSTDVGIAASGGILQFIAGGSERWRVGQSGPLQPEVDNSYSVGSSSFRASVIYAGTGTINTSDEREKQDVRDISEAERAVAVSLKALFRAYRFKDAVAAKGDAARIHFGVMAQEAAAAFEAQGLDPFRYGVICYDEWPAELDDDGNIVTPAGNRWGVRYDELLAFIVAAL